MMIDSIWQHHDDWIITVERAGKEKCGRRDNGMEEYHQEILSKDTGGQDLFRAMNVHAIWQGILMMMASPG